MTTRTWETATQAQRRSILLPRRRVLYVPVPKAGSTSIRWALAGIAGISPERFLSSRLPVPAPAHTVHDLSRWPDRHRWNRLDQGRQDEIAKDPSWLRFTVVRSPWSRIWSAWQSKLLLREPLYVGNWDPAEEWWPRIPRRAAEVVEDFRRFVLVLADADRRPVDPHWQPQSTLLSGAPPLSYVGRTEDMPSVLGTLAGHVGVPVGELDARRDGATPLPYSPDLFDYETRRVVSRLYADDIRSFAYPEDPGHGDGIDAWTDRCDAVIPAVTEIIARHERIGQLGGSDRSAGGRRAQARHRSGGVRG